MWTSGESSAEAGDDMERLRGNVTYHQMQECQRDHAFLRRTNLNRGLSYIFTSREFRSIVSNPKALLS